MHLTNIRYYPKTAVYHIEIPPFSGVPDMAIVVLVVVVMAAVAVELTGVFIKSRSLSSR
jgi:hypothetical protein